MKIKLKLAYVFAKVITLNLHHLIIIVQNATTNVKIAARVLIIVQLVTKKPAISGLNQLLLHLNAHVWIGICIFYFLRKKI
jgi:hypothetical protein